MEKNPILIILKDILFSCILKGLMPFKMHKIIFFPEKYVCLFRPVTLITITFFLFDLSSGI